MKTITNIIYPVFAIFALGCFGLSPQARAVCQEGCLTNDNTVLGDDALLNNTTGSANTAIGSNALLSNTTGIGNTATGVQALAANTIGNHNTAYGCRALVENTSGVGNVAVGEAALFNNTTGGNNIAVGEAALGQNTTGSDNTATGNLALAGNTTGNGNIALGASAGINLTTGSNNIYIGNAGGRDGESNKIRIGVNGTHNHAAIAGIYGTTIPTGVSVMVSPGGRLGTVTSSARFKGAIKPMDKASEAIHALKPVTFHYKQEIDPDGIPQFGLVAEDVAKVNPDLVARDDQGKPYTVRYEAVNAMLLNEFLKAHRELEEQSQINQRQEATIARLEAALKEQAAQIQKVSAHLELSKPATKVVAHRR